ncbi:hypothetical protein ACU4GD_28055 [Cupriavidus basilensis]
MLTACTPTAATTCGGSTDRNNCNWWLHLVGRKLPQLGGQFALDLAVGLEVQLPDRAEQALQSLHPEAGRCHLFKGNRQLCHQIRIHLVQQTDDPLDQPCRVLLQIDLVSDGGLQQRLIDRCHRSDPIVPRARPLFLHGFQLGDSGSMSGARMPRR